MPKLANKVKQVDYHNWPRLNCISNRVCRTTVMQPVCFFIWLLSNQCKLSTAVVNVVVCE